jgi:FMN phosphatase YigB (HAD superfamily)
MSPTALKALLLDLDDTLIDNPMDAFIPAYFKALEGFVADVVSPERFITELLAATRAMNRNDGSGPSNAEVFAAAFYPALGVERAEFEPVLERFYREAFPSLAPLVGSRAAAPRIVDWAFERGLQVAIATNPLFPRTAIEQRMAWGGVGVDRYPYDLVTSYENCHATKSDPAYYREIVGTLGRRPEECLMVGDNWDWDIACAAEAGIPGYWIAADGVEVPSPRVDVVGRGDLDSFLAAVGDGSLEARLEELVLRNGSLLATGVWVRSSCSACPKDRGSTSPHTSIPNRCWKCTSRTSRPGPSSSRPRPSAHRGPEWTAGGSVTSRRTSMRARSSWRVRRARSLAATCSWRAPSRRWPGY